MQLPSYWLPRPAFELTDAYRAAFDALLAQPWNPAGLEYTLDAPKWAFLCYAAEAHGLALHGSLNPDITEFEPRQANDLREFGAQKAVYAASDGIWPMYFAIVDRIRYADMSLMNACIHVEMPDGTRTPSLYFFSVPKHLIGLHPYTTGWVYLLPKETFHTDPPFSFGEAKVHPAQLASPVAVKPFAKLLVTPEDFPFLATMRAHENERLQVYADALSNAQPWPDEASAS